MERITDTKREILSRARLEKGRGAFIAYETISSYEATLPYCRERREEEKGDKEGMKVVQVGARPRGDAFWMSLTDSGLGSQDGEPGRCRVNDNNNNNETVLRSFGEDRTFALIPK